MRGEEEEAWGLGMWKMKPFWEKPAKLGDAGIGWQDAEFSLEHGGFGAAEKHLEGDTKEVMRHFLYHMVEPINLG